MSSITFNNLNFCKKLTDTGIPPQQANVLAESIHEITTSIENNFATKKDLVELRSELKSEIKEVKTDMKTEIKKLEIDILDLKSNVKVLNWMMGFLMAGVGSLVMKAFF